MTGIDWGDVPTWVAVAVAAAGGTIALVQLRQQGRVIQAEFRRNAEQENARLREQAEAVEIICSSLEPGPGFEVRVINESRRPIRDLACLAINPTGMMGMGMMGGMGGMQVSVPVSVVELHSVTVEGMRSWLPDQETRRDGREGYRVLRGRGCRCAFSFGQLPWAPPATFVAEFADDAGIRWRLNNEMHLVRILDDADR